MFWKFDLHTSSQVDKLLDKEDVTLHELMEEDDILQECKAQNRRLLLFICQDHCMQELVTLITQEPPLDVEEKMRFKYPNIACELLTSDVSNINDKLGEDESLLERLYGFLEQEPPLNPLLASFFSKTIGNLIARKTEQVITFLRKKEGFLDLVLKRIDASAMMDLLLRLISCVEPAALRQEVLNWLNEAKLVQRLVDLLRPEEDEERQSNASQTLCDIIRLSRDQTTQPQDAVELDPLMAVLESEQSVSDLLNNMFSGEKSEACIINGSQVLLTLLETRRPVVEGLMDLCSQGYERYYTVNSSILQGIQLHLKDFHQLLLEPPKKSAILTTIGVLNQPLGNGRLHIARLVASLLQCCTPSIDQELCRLHTMDLLLDLFFEYTWNNFLHFQVELCLAAVLNHPGQEEEPREQGEKVEPETGHSDTTSIPDSSVHHALVAHLFQKCRLVQRILDAWEENDRIQAEGGMRRGYMGHLTRIANTVVQNMEKGPVQSQIINLIKELPEDCRGRWESFVDETLTETNRRNTVELVSTHNLHSSSEDDDMEGPFPNELSIQQAFSDYQIQQMTANFVDQFGFNDEEFAEPDDNINATFDRIAEINFNLDVDEESANVTMFEACCKERIQQFEDNEEEEDIWDDKAINYTTQVKARMRDRFGMSQTSNRSSKGEGKNGHEDQSNTGTDEEDNDCRSGIQAEGRQNTGWTATFENQLADGTETGSNMWDLSTSQNFSPHTEEKGWAKFTDIQPFCCSETGYRCSSPVDSHSSEGCVKQSQEKNLKNATPCTWTVCSTRKAPLVASDSSSSGGSDSEEDDDRTDVVTDNPTADPANNVMIKTTSDRRSKVAMLSCEVDSLPVSKLSLCDELPESQGKTNPTGDALCANTDLTVTDRKEEMSPLAKVNLNGPA